MYLQVTLAVGFRGEGRQADQADEWPLSCRTDGRLSAKGRGTGTAGTLHGAVLARRVPAAGSRMPPPIFTGLRWGKTYK